MRWMANPAERLCSMSAEDPKPESAMAGIGAACARRLHKSSRPLPSGSSMSLTMTSSSAWDATWSADGHIGGRVDVISAH